MMARSTTPLALVMALGVIASCTAHICLIHPPQRSFPGIAGPGDMACFEPTAPCGTKPSGDPTRTIQGGEAFDVLFQQNLNHYNPGFPGFLDVAWHTFPDPPTDDGFTTLATVPDYWAHLQAQQTNFTVSVVAPNIDCEHCVLRVRYHPNKPTEPIFHNCADVKIVKSSSPSRQSSVYAFAGLKGEQSVFRNQFVNVLPSGEVMPTSSQPSHIFPEGLSAVDQSTGTIWSISYPAADQAKDLPPNYLTSYNSASGFSTPVPITFASSDTSPRPQQWDALVSGTPSNPLLILGRVANGSAGFRYQVRLLSESGQVSGVVAETEPQLTFVNFMWAANVDVKRNMFYFIAGDENSLRALRLQVFTVNLSTGDVSTVLQDNSKFTISTVHLEPVSGRLYAVSPGLYTPDHTSPYSLVILDPSTGGVSEVGEISHAGIFNYAYGGGVYGTSVSQDGSSLYHIFQHSIDGSYVLARVNLASGTLEDAPSIITGINSAIELKTFVLVA